MIESNYFKNPLRYENLSTEYPPRPPLGQIKPKDVHLTENGKRVYGVRYIKHLYELIKKRYGVLPEDLFIKNVKRENLDVLYDESFLLELAIYVMDGIPYGKIAEYDVKNGSYFDPNQYKNLSQETISVYIYRYFSELPKKIAVISKQKERLHSLLYSENEKTREYLVAIQKKLDLTIFEIFNVNSKVLPSQFSKPIEASGDVEKRKVKKEHTISELSTFVHMLYLKVVEGLSVKEILDKAEFSGITHGNVATVIYRNLTAEAKARINKI